MTTETQQVPYVGLPTTDKLSVRETRFAVGKAHAEWVGCWHAQMYVLARQGSTFGEFSTTIRSFVDSYGGHVPDPRTEAFDGWRDLCIDLWEAFASNGVVEIDGDPADTSKRFRVRVLDFAETNVPRPPRPRTLTDEERRARDAERKRRKRAEQSNPANPHEPVDVREMSDASADASECPPPNRSDQTRPEETDRIKVSTPSSPPPIVDNSELATDGLTFQPSVRTGGRRREIDDATAYELDRLLDLLRDADDGTKGVLEHLARQGAGPADFADAREAIRACSPLKPAAYAVRTIANRLAEALKRPTPTIGAIA